MDNNLYKIYKLANRRGAKYIQKYHIISDYEIKNEKILTAFENIKNRGITIIFGKRITDNGYSLNANAAIKKEINIKTSWIIQLMLHNDDEIVINSFLITLGHELAHHLFDKQLTIQLKKEKLYGFKYKKLIYKIREVHHDFYGCYIFCDSNQHSLIQSCAYKKNHNTIFLQRKEEKDAFHPNWNQRIEYAEYGLFNRKLLDKIAKDNKLDIKNEEIQKLLDNIMDFYGEIKLK